MTWVFKIKSQNTLRRLSIEEEEDGKLGLTFMDLLAKIRNMFHLSAEERLVLTYTDQDNDVVTMGDDDDLQDACMVQRMNPLRIHVNLVDTESLAAQEPRPFKPSYQGGSPRLSNILVEELIKHLDCSHAIKASFQKLHHDRALDSRSCAQGNVSWREAESGGAMLWDSGAVDTIRQRVFHKGVQCDSCGMVPIVGPRFKSTWKENHDLCCRCFTEAGDETNFRRIDRPSLSRRHCPRQWATGGKGKKRHPTSSMVACTPASCMEDQNVHGPFRANIMMHTGRDHSTKKLDARFVRDVTIFDGTEMAAGTHFTKIWRLRNIGTLPWPHATHLVYTGGDVLGSASSSFVELPVEGLQCEEEVDVSVDLLAPPSPGRYVSHWRLRAPTGQKFGQRIWVLIQVVVSQCTQKSGLAEAATCLAKVDVNTGVPRQWGGQVCKEATLTSQFALETTTEEDGQCIVKNDSDNLDACDVRLSSGPMSAQDRQGIQDLIHGAGKPLISMDMVDASCHVGCPYGGSLDKNKGLDMPNSSNGEY